MERDVQEIITEMPKGLFRWYDFEKEARLLLVTGDGYPYQAEIRSYLETCVEEVVVADAMRMQDKAFADTCEGNMQYVVVVKALETAEEPTRFLSSCARFLKPNGRLLLATDNRLGIRFFCGDRDPYTDRSFDGVEDYRRLQARDRQETAGRCYAQAELCGFLGAAGFKTKRFYSVFPNLELPQLLFAENFIPQEDLSTRVKPMYGHPDSVFLEEQYLYKTLLENGMFHKMANAYVIECAKDKKASLSDVDHVTLSTERGREQAIMTRIRSGCMVEKIALFPEGVEGLYRLAVYSEKLAKRGIHVVPSTLEGNVYRMPYVNAQTAQKYLENLLYTDKEAFIREMDRFREQILQSSEHLRTDDRLGVILEEGFTELVPVNCFYMDEDYVFFDQEFMEAECPANKMICRMVDIVYSNRKQMENVLPMDFFWERYGLANELDFWRKEAHGFFDQLKHTRELRPFREQYEANLAVVGQNRLRVNYSYREYELLFRELFSDLPEKKLFLFGSGMFTKRFLDRFGEEYEVSGILDNNEDKWGQQVKGIALMPPSSLEQLDPDTYKVIVCVKDFAGIMLQLRKLGVKHLGIFDAYADYPVKRKQIQDYSAKGTKKYKVGYIAGVFDLFHIGHLNMFRRAKEQCEYLIVGVVTDEMVRKGKKVEPFVPFEERLEMVRACRYVDEAYAIPASDGSSREAFRRYHFDVQFSGSDYVDNPDWMAEKAYLEKNGATLEFFPYTQSTSSTKLKGLISQKLI